MEPQNHIRYFFFYCSFIFLCIAVITHAELTCIENNTQGSSLSMLNSFLVNKSKQETDAIYRFAGKHFQAGQLQRTAREKHPRKQIP